MMNLSAGTPKFFLKSVYILKVETGENISRLNSKKSNLSFEYPKIFTPFIFFGVLPLKLVAYICVSKSSFINSESSTTTLKQFF